MLDFAVLLKSKSAVPPVEVILTDRASARIPSLYSFSPLRDDRWDAFVEQHPRASVFHTSAWLEALHRTYGYAPIAYTTSAPTESLDNAVVFCRVESWLTGRRLVSLPFSDHCEPLMDAEAVSGDLSPLVARELGENHWRYVEFRPLEPIPVEGPFSQWKIEYAFHELDLTPSLDVIFHNFHKSSIQRKIKRAVRENLRYREGSNPELLDHFYRLFQLTRRRHKLPPQPRKWFEHLAKCFGSALKVRVAYNTHQAVAAMITIRHRKTLVYKYGCSDSRFNNLGSMHLLYWQAIQDGKNQALHSFDFGRTDRDQHGLITFKNRWGAKESRLTYLRCSAHEAATHFFDLPAGNLTAQAAKSLMSYFPARIVSRIGQLLYGHVG
jgi:CelD/BcsL family acetyltransferase involved in cellulose biosynthesis